MERRNFIKLTSYGVLGLNSVSNYLLKPSDHNDVFFPDLANHKIDKVELIEVNFHWPRFVGKNGRRDFHGQYNKSIVMKLITDQGAMGWGLSSSSAKDVIPKLIKNKVSDLIIPGLGVSKELNRLVDFALYDLSGMILNKPVYQLLGSKGNLETPLYSGMIYLDELNPENITKGLDAILENCEWDYNFGYRQLKVKIGRSGRWYTPEEGLKKDIEVTKLIYEAFKNKNIEILVDSNDMYTVSDTLKFLEGIGDIPLFWVEEPFREELKAGRELREWMNKNGFKKTYYADGEANPDPNICLQLGKENIMNVYLPDIFGLGFTEWIKLIPELQKINMFASPHAWGDRLKTHYITHLSSGIGNIVTIEGVTCFSEDIDYGDFQLKNGKIRVSNAPGFGMKLLK